MKKSFDLSKLNNDKFEEMNEKFEEILNMKGIYTNEDDIEKVEIYLRRLKYIYKSFNIKRPEFSIEENNNFKLLCGIEFREIYEETILCCKRIVESNNREFNRSNYYVKLD